MSVQSTVLFTTEWQVTRAVVLLSVQSAVLFILSSQNDSSWVSVQYCLYCSSQNDIRVSVLSTLLFVLFMTE